MSRSQLKVFSRDGELLFELAREEEEVRVLSAVASMSPAITRWLDGGLRELVPSESGARVPRLTAPSDPTFFKRLSEHLERQFGFAAKLDEGLAPHYEFVTAAFISAAAALKQPTNAQPKPAFLTKVLPPVDGNLLCANVRTA